MKARISMMVKQIRLKFGMECVLPRGTFHRKKNCASYRCMKTALTWFLYNTHLSVVHPHWLYLAAWPTIVCLEANLVIFYVVILSFLVSVLFIDPYFIFRLVIMVKCQSSDFLTELPCNAIILCFSTFHWSLPHFRIYKYTSLFSFLNYSMWLCNKFRVTVLLGWLLH